MATLEGYDNASPKVRQFQAELEQAQRQHAELASSLFQLGTVEADVKKYTKSTNLVQQYPLSSTVHDGARDLMSAIAARSALRLELKAEIERIERRIDTLQRKLVSFRTLL